MTKPKDKIAKRTHGSDVAAFLDKVAAMPAVRAARQEHGRLVFALDATMSREAAWDRAMHLQAEMFDVAAAIGGVAIQLVFFRGYNGFSASPWCVGADALLNRMTGVSCRGGYTQIARVLRHVRKESKTRRVNTVVYVGDCVEEEPDTLYRLAGELRILGVPLFLFQEGNDPTASRIFAEMARLSGGVHCPFDNSSASQLRSLLKAAAVYAAGGRPALIDYDAAQHGEVRHLIEQIK